jgi:hypothetical protein
MTIKNIKHFQHDNKNQKERRLLNKYSQYFNKKLKHFNNREFVCICGNKSNIRGKRYD